MTSFTASLMRREAGSDALENASIARLRRTIYHLEGGLLVAILLAMILLAVIQILLRNTTGAGIVWNEAVVRVLVLWVAFLGAMIGSRKGEHISIELVSHYLPPLYQRSIRLIVGVISSLLCLLAAWVCLQFVLSEYHEQTVAFAGIPAWICQLILPVGFFTIGLRLLLNAFIPDEKVAQ